MVKFYEITCEICGKKFLSVSPKRKYCIDCKFRKKNLFKLPFKGI